MSAAFTKGPWEAWLGKSGRGYAWSVSGPSCVVARCLWLPAGDPEDNARLIAAAPELYDGCNAMLGLVQLILGRDDLSAELCEVLTTNHRVAEAEAATAKARGDQ